MAKQSFREVAEENPRLAALSLVAYAAIGVFRPRWLTVAARRTPRQWLGVLAVQLLFTAVSAWWRLRAERSLKAREELRHELGREPTHEEQHARAEELRQATD